jgi:cysteine synthase
VVERTESVAHGSKEPEADELGAPVAFLDPDLGDASRSARAQSTGTIVNDVHCQLNETHVDRVVAVDSEAALRRAIGAARRDGKAVSIAGGRHAMGGQQWAGTGASFRNRPELIG